MRIIETQQNGRRKIHKFPKSSINGGTIGRSSSNEIVVSDAYVSRSHCRIEIIDNVPFLLDLGSGTGTFLNGEQITKHPLKPGDIFKMGKSEYEFQVKDGDEIFTKTKFFLILQMKIVT